MKAVVSAKVKQSSVFGTLMTFAIAIITWGVTNLQANTESWYIYIGAIAIGLIMIVIDTYVLKSQENC